MKEKIILMIIAVAAIAGSLSTAEAQEKNSWFKKGYSFDFELATARPFDQNAFSTSHGYSFGNGLFVGGGLGFEYSAKDDKFLTPVFGEARWSMFDKTVTPYIDARVGYMIIASHGNSFYFSPTIGLDIWKFSAFLGWDVMPNYNSGFKFGIGIHF